MPGFDGMKLVDRLRKRADHADNACQFGDASDMRGAAAEIERLRKIETAARALKFSAYPAHGSGFVMQVSGGNINDLEAALKSAE